jgi:hypothetical protein
LSLVISKPPIPIWPVHLGQIRIPTPILQHDSDCLTTKMLENRQKSQFEVFCPKWFDLKIANVDIT